MSRKADFGSGINCYLFTPYNDQSALFLNSEASTYCKSLAISSKLVPFLLSVDSEPEKVQTQGYNFCACSTHLSMKFVLLINLKLLLLVTIANSFWTPVVLTLASERYTIYFDMGTCLYVKELYSRYSNIAFRETCTFLWRSS